MGTIVSIADAIVLLLVIALVPRSVSKGLSGGLGPLILSVCVAVFVIIFAVVSFTASVAFLEGTLAQFVWLLILLVMAYVIRMSWIDKPAE